MGKKAIYTAVVLAALGIAFWLVSPLFIDKEVDEGLQEIFVQTEKEPQQVPMEQKEEMPAVISSGQFAGVLGHNAEGTATLIKSGEKYFVRFEDDFKITNGPNLFVYLGKDGKYDPNARL